jgi:hypothetical protein
MKEIYDRLYISMGDDEIRKYLPRVPILKYIDLQKYDRITDLLREPRSCAVILVELSTNVGHWIALIRNGNNIYFFDPYGYRPDKQLLWVPKYMRAALGQNVPFISYLLNRALSDGFKVSFNEIDYQSKSENIATCGRWVVSRCLFALHERDPTPEQYYKLIKKFMKDYGLSPDLVICKLVR